MGLKVSKGNMYDWVTHMHSHLAGECPHKCSYCYVQRNKFGVSERYKGEPRLIESELNENYGTGKTIFIEHMNDLFAEKVKGRWIIAILKHCREYDNDYVFQTKNPERVYFYYHALPKKSLLGTTIETNRNINNISKAPIPQKRYEYLKKLRKEGVRVFITIEPIMDFDVDILSKWIIDIRPEFINIGADSKGCGLLEPSAQKILEFINILNENKINIKKKTNLSRLLQ